MRQLASFTYITAIDPILDADAIEAATVKGWTVVVRKGEFHVGQPVVYFEIDSLLPVTSPEFAFLADRGIRTFTDEHQNTHTGHVLKTVKLRGVYSQGLILPADLFALEIATHLKTGEDLASLLNIHKYEPPMPFSDSKDILGPFPTHIAPKTDAERTQNLTNFSNIASLHSWQATEKIDGMSVTIINDNGTMRVCSRNWELAPPQPNSTPSTIWRAALEIFPYIPTNYTVQAELAGEGIQSNRLRLKGQRLFIFSILKNRQYLPRTLWPEELLEHATPTYQLTLPDTIPETLNQVDGIKSLISPQRLAEGIVWHRTSNLHAPNTPTMFKAISNKYLTKEK